VLKFSLIKINIIDDEISIFTEVWYWVVNWVTLWRLERGCELSTESSLSISKVLMGGEDFRIDSEVWYFVANFPVWGVPGGLTGSLIPW